MTITGGEYCGNCLFPCEGGGYLQYCGLHLGTECPGKGTNQTVSPQKSTNPSIFWKLHSLRWALLILHHSFILPDTKDTSQLCWARRAKQGSSPLYSNFYYLFISSSRHWFLTPLCVTSAGRPEERQRCSQAEREGCSLLGLESHGLRQPWIWKAGLQFTVCVTVNRVRLVVNNFRNIFHLGRVNFLSQPQLFNIPTSDKAWHKLCV